MKSKKGDTKEKLKIKPNLIKFPKKKIEIKQNNDKVDFNDGDIDDDDDLSSKRKNGTVITNLIKADVEGKIEEKLLEKILFLSQKKTEHQLKPHLKTVKHQISQEKKFFSYVRHSECTLNKISNQCVDFQKNVHVQNENYLNIIENKNFVRPDTVTKKLNLLCVKSTETKDGNKRNSRRKESLARQT